MAQSHTGFWFAGALAGAFILPGTTAFAQDAVWDHARDQSNVTLNVPLERDASSFVLTIQNTCPDVFSFPTEALRAHRRDPAVDDYVKQLTPGAEIPETFPYCITRTHRLAFAHDADTTGYLVTVQGPEGTDSTHTEPAFRPDNENSPSNARMEEIWKECRDIQSSAETSSDSEDTPAHSGGNSAREAMQTCVIERVPGEFISLTPAFFVVTVDSKSIFDFSGSFVISNLVDRTYTVRDDIIARNRDAEDSVRANFGAFVHVMPWMNQNLGLAAGIGIDSSKLDLFAGGSYRLGRVRNHSAYLVFGAHVGSVTTLPANESLGQPLRGDELPTKLPTKTDTGFFIGLNFSFLGDARGTLSPRFEVPKAVNGD